MDPQTNGHGRAFRCPICANGRSAINPNARFRLRFLAGRGAMAPSMARGAGAPCLADASSDHAHDGKLVPESTRESPALFKAGRKERLHRGERAGWSRLSTSGREVEDEDSGDHPLCKERPSALADLRLRRIRGARTCTALLERSDSKLRRGARRALGPSRWAVSTPVGNWPHSIARVPSSVVSFSPSLTLRRPGAMRAPHTPSAWTSIRASTNVFDSDRNHSGSARF
jgi:hypothetical protein